MKTKKEMKNTNKGFTLIELIVTVAIIAIFSGVILTFVTTGSNTYRSTSSTAKVQMETQETFDRIEDMIINVNRSLYYANVSGKSIGSEIKDDIKKSGEGNSTGDKTFIICNEYQNPDGSNGYSCDVLYWNKEKATIYYRQYDPVSNSGSAQINVATFASGEDVAVNVGEGTSSDEGFVLATGILDFRADLSKVESDKIVRFQLSTENGTKQIETLHSISLRNKAKVQKPGDFVIVTPKPTLSPVPTTVPEPTATPVPTATPEPTATPIPTETPTPEPTATPVPDPNPTVTPLPTPKPTEGDIILGNNMNFNIVLAGKIRAYDSKAYNTHGFGVFFKDWKKDNLQAKLEWYIKNENSLVTVDNVPDFNPASDVFVNIQKDCKTGFILGARYSGLDNSGNPVSGYAEREFYVANGIELQILDTDHHLIPAGSDITLGKEYLIHPYIKVYDASGNMYGIDVTPTRTNDANKPRISASWYIEASPTDDGLYWKFVPQGKGKTTIEMKLNKLTEDQCGIFGDDYNGTNEAFEQSVELNAVEATDGSTPTASPTPTFTPTPTAIPGPSPTVTPVPKLDAQIITNGSLRTGEKSEIYLKLTDEQGNEVEKNVIWEGIPEIWYLDNQKSGINNKIQFTPLYPRTYEITAKYFMVAGDWNSVVTVKKTITVTN